MESRFINLIKKEAVFLRFITQWGIFCHVPEPTPRILHYYIYSSHTFFSFENKIRVMNVRVFCKMNWDYAKNKDIGY